MSDQWYLELAEDICKQVYSAYKKDKESSMVIPTRLLLGTLSALTREVVQLDKDKRFYRGLLDKIQSNSNIGT